MEDWEALAPLNAQQKSSVALLQEAVSVKPIPLKLLANGSVGHSATTRPATPTASTSFLRRIESRIATPPRAASPRPSTAAKPLQAIETPAQFYDWYTSNIEASIESEQLVGYVQHLAAIQSFVASCQEMLDGLAHLQGYLRELEANYKFVEENSRVLQSACEEMLQEQKHLIEVSEAISARLDYFRELEKATRQLNLPGETLVLEPDFLNLIDRLDICLDFFKANRAFKDAEIYTIRFQQCLTRSLTLIKIYFSSHIDQLTQEVIEKRTGKDLSEAALHALLYTKFSSQAEELRLLLVELEKRAAVDPNEYASLLDECYATWFASRTALLADTLSEEVKRMEPYTTDIAKLTRTGCSYLRSVCVAEWNLFSNFFSQAGERHIYQYLEGLCDQLYDFVRPRILHESTLDKLSELCTVIQALMALDPSFDMETEDLDLLEPLRSPIKSPNSSNSTPQKSYFAHSPVPIMTSTPQRGSPAVQNSRPLPNLKFSRLLTPLLQDAQTRMVFRAQAIIQNEVLHYQPSSADLDYPVKLGHNRRLSLWLSQEDAAGLLEKGSSLESRMPPREIQDSWYPTLQKTLWVLSRLHTHINSAIFEDFAGEAVTLCRQSLSSAAARLAQGSKSTQLDGQLFTIRHFLILREMVASVDLVQVERAADFSSMTDVLGSLLWNGSSLLNPSTLFETVSRSMPNFQETMKDAKLDLDAALKAVCEDLIAKAGLMVAAPIVNFTGRAKAYLAKPAEPNAAVDLTAQMFATPEQVQVLHDSFTASEGTLEIGFKDLLGKLNLWLSGEKTVSVLLTPIIEEVTEAYSDFQQLVKSEYEFEVSSGLMSPSTVKDKLRAVAEQQGNAAPIKK